MGAFLSGLSFLFFFWIVFYTLRYGQRVTEPRLLGPAARRDAGVDAAEPAAGAHVRDAAHPRHVGPPGDH